MQAKSSPPDARRVVPVRLTEVPLDARMRGAEAACKHERDESEKYAIFAAALVPSDTVYWIARG